MSTAKRLRTRTALASLAAAAAGATMLPAPAFAHESPPDAPTKAGEPARTSTEHAGHGDHCAPAEHGAHDELLARARRATEQFRDLDAAKAAGYEKASGCEADPKYGAMGVQYANPKLVADGKLDIERPEILVYQPSEDGELRLGAIEYFQVDGDQDLATDPDRPSLFGMPFDGPMLGHNPEMPIHYDLHVWLYRDNPAGLFAMWNPSVDCATERAA